MQPHDAAAADLLATPFDRLSTALALLILRHHRTHFLAAESWLIASSADISCRVIATYLPLKRDADFLGR